MSRTLPVDLHVQPDDSALPTAFSAVGSDGQVTVIGTMSLGGRGWQLSAQAVMVRRRITVYVYARNPRSRQPTDIEDLRYVATVLGLDSGRYQVRVVHVLREPPHEQGPQFLTFFETRLELQPSGTPARADSSLR